MNDLNGQPFFCSWSGGKDSTLALDRAFRQSGVPKFLFTIGRPLPRWNRRASTLPAKWASTTRSRLPARSFPPRIVLQVKEQKLHEGYAFLIVA